jgi:inosine triphosphate pyrophosphatase
MIITFITGNSKKVDEIQNILGTNFPHTLKPVKIDLPELQGEPEYIATEKCRLASLQVDGPCIIEDTSLCFNALGGLPGPYVKWFLDKTGLDGLNNLLMAYKDKTAYAQTIFAYTKGKGEPIHLFIGRLDGKIVPARGSLGFGWDAIFQPVGCGGNGEDGIDGICNSETFGEMEQSKKNMISHRYLALMKLCNGIA